MDKPFEPESTHRVGFLLIDGFALMSYASAVEPLRAGNLLAEKELYELRNIAVAGDEATSSSGAIVRADAVIGYTSLDTLFVVAGGNPEGFRDDDVFAWLRQLARSGIRLGGISGGPVVLAAAGVMQDRRMTVHWEHAAALGEISPLLLVERSLYVIDRDRVTCAGGTAPLDLMHALIAEQQGPQLARKVSDWFLHTEVRPSGGPQRAGRVVRYETTDRSVLSAIEAMENHLADPLSLSQLARISGVSPRQLNRQFRAKLGTTTMAFYRNLRLETARRLITHSSLAMTEIALATGFANSAHFATTHSNRYGKPPSSIRS